MRKTPRVMKISFIPTSNTINFRVIFLIALTIPLNSTTVLYFHEAIYFSEMVKKSIHKINSRVPSIDEMSEIGFGIPSRASI